MGGQTTTSEQLAAGELSDAAFMAERAMEAQAADDYDRALKLVAVVRDTAARAEAALVAVARERGASWQHIGDQLGVTRSAVHQRFADKTN